MMGSSVLGLREKFLMAYANLPLPARKEIVVVIEDGGVKKPITWNVAYLEASQDTSLGNIILEKLNNLGLI